MGATVDRSQKIKFYFGNANEDLAHLLPKDEIDPGIEIAAINAVLNRTEDAFVELKSSHRKLSFLLADLKRMF